MLKMERVRSFKILAF